MENCWFAGRPSLAATGASPTRTQECFDSEGWFKTGDIAHLDQDGFLYITDRKKELLKTSGGKLVAPQPIENKLKTSLLVGQAALVGDKHKFISALISPNFAALEEWARHHEIRARTRAELGEHIIASSPSTVSSSARSTRVWPTSKPSSGSAWSPKNGLRIRAS